MVGAPFPRPVPEMSIGQALSALRLELAEGKPAERSLLWWIKRREEINKAIERLEAQP